jgi:MerR family transcriptional regulator, heat shock protein HspR
MNNYYLQLYRRDSSPKDLTYKESANEMPYQPILLERLAAIGAIELIDGRLSWEDVERVDKILRLREFFGVNLSGATIIIELLDKLEAMEEEIKKQTTV